MVIPANVTLLHLLPNSPALNPMEKVFGFLKSNPLANCVFPNVDGVRAATTRACDSFAADARRVRSLTTRSRARTQASISIVKAEKPLHMESVRT